MESFSLQKKTEVLFHRNRTPVRTGGTLMKHRRRKKKEPEPKPRPLLARGYASYSVRQAGCRLPDAHNISSGPVESEGNPFAVLHNY